MEIVEPPKIIRAHLFWNCTGLQLEAGQTYIITASGCWVDFFIPHGPDGGPSTFAYLRPFEPRRRLPTQNWFILAGAIDSDPSTVFSIGSYREYTATRCGELTCFANDVPEFYWNNWGHVTMALTRTG
jgi:hypothetical protein